MPAPNPGAVPVGHAASPSPAFRVLFVCTGNICRSPIAERLLQARLTAARGATVRSASAGLRAVSGYPMDSLAAEVLTDLGGDAHGHVARQITADMVREADLVLTASTEHRARIVRDQPAVMRRTFTLREFARLGSTVQVSDNGMPLAGRVREVASQRGLVDAVDPTSDDIADPFGATADVMRACGIAIAETVDVVTRVLGLAQEG